VISPVLGRKAVSDTVVCFVKCVMPLQVMAVANRNGLKSRAIRSVAPADPPPPACCSVYRDRAEDNTAAASVAAGVDEKPFPISIDVACSVLLTPLQRVCMQPACRIIAQVSTMCSAC
jgi:hypothetical protein